MAVEEADRRVLAARLTEALGTEAADTLLNSLPPTGWADVATVGAVDDAELRLSTRIDAFERTVTARFETVQQTMAARFESVEQTMTARFETVEQTMSARFETVDARFDALEQRIVAVFHGELVAAVTAQTRMVLFAMAGTVLTLAGIALGALRTSM